MKHTVTTIIGTMMILLCAGCGAKTDAQLQSTEKETDSTEQQTDHTFRTETVGGSSEIQEMKETADPYKEILDEYYQAIYVHQTYPEQWDKYKYAEKGLVSDIVTPYWSWDNSENMLNKIGFAFMDLNGDDIDELVLGWTGNECWNLDEGYVFVIYTIVDGKATLAVEGWNRNRYIIGEDGYLYNNGSSSSTETTYTKYKFSTEREDFLEPVEKIYSYYSYDDDEELWEHITDPEDIGVIEYAEKHQELLIDEAEAETMGESWMESGTLIDYTLFSEYDS
jgi:hypothetical protein